MHIPGLILSNLIQAKEKLTQVRDYAKIAVMVTKSGEGRDQ